MSVTITVSKALLDEFPEVSYQLFYLASHEEQKQFTYVFTVLGYYRELTDLLDLYQIPYTVYSSKNISLLHILIVEADESLALALKEQLEKWGFRSVEIADRYYHTLRNKNRKMISLAIIDKQTAGSLSLAEQLRLLLQLLRIPIIYLMAYLDKWKPNIWQLLKKSLVLRKPFRERELQQAVERLLNIALIHDSEKK